ncbi:MAG: hypothetical protein GX434_03405 [Peptococcaceae bacterium]|nr:hypothetical protein [Peptococcaceae bacterium]
MFAIRKPKLTIFFALILLLILVLQVVFLRYFYNQTLKNIGSQTITISQIVADRIDIDAYEQGIASGERNEYFYSMQDYFQIVQKQTGVEYVYVAHALSDEEIEYDLNIVANARRSFIFALPHIFFPNLFIPII